ncbi:hypothetical protein OROHE_018773 [Orobanche hederae]
MMSGWIPVEEVFEQPICRLVAFHVIYDWKIFREIFL